MEGFSERRRLIALACAHLKDLLKLYRIASQDLSELIMHPHLSLNTPSQETKTRLRTAYATATSADCQRIIISPHLSIDRLILPLFKMMLLILKGILFLFSLHFSGQILEFKCEWGGGNYHRSEREGHPQTLWEVARSSFLWRPAFSQVHLESEYDKFHLWECTESPSTIYTFILLQLM